MRRLAALLILVGLAMPAAAQTAAQRDALVKRVTKIIADANQVENASQRVMAEAKRLEADVAKIQPQPIVTPPVIAPPIVVVPPPVEPPVVAPPVTTPGFVPDPFVSPTPTGMVPIASNFDTAPYLVETGIPGSAAPDVVGAFRFLCEPGQLNWDDPIVAPGIIGGSKHPHQWFGNTLGDGKSTYKSLRTTGESTCMNKLNRSAYWVPAMVDQNGKNVTPDYLNVYYKRRPKSDPVCQVQGKACVGTPNGLRYIFGYDMTKMMSRPDQPENTHFYYTCITPQWAHRGEKQKLLKGMPCLPGDTLTALMDSPDCWDGKNLDSPDHRSHMARSNYANCPSTHPYIVPTFTLAVNYRVQAGDVVDQWYVASDRMDGMEAYPSGKTWHADFFMAWDPTVKTAWEANCIDKLLNCSGGTIGDGTVLKAPLGYMPQNRPRVAIPLRP